MPVSCSWLVFKLTHSSMLVFYCSYFQMAAYITLTSNIFHIPSMPFLSAELYTSTVFKHFIFLILWCGFAVYDSLEYVIDKYVSSLCTFPHLCSSSLWQWWNWNSARCCIVGCRCWFQCRGTGKDKCDTFQQQGETLWPGQQCPHGSWIPLLSAVFAKWNRGYNTGMLQPGHKHEGAARIYAHLFILLKA